ncbi:MAG: Holliday junction resolvase RuvX [Anaerovoracaceae bacterium]|nr:Holliday junction resolvase RuvX [Bacillota bacterium]MDY2671281.1 Holliday junction resolvase RuvX [Anaerovoracaceae bacterium]
MRAISLDVGDKTIGVAVSDPLMLTAQGITTIDRIGIRKDCDKVIKMIKEYECDTVVIGLPLNLDGGDSVQTQKVRDFRTMLENKMRSTAIKGVTCVFQDERFTTKIAESVLIDADVSRSKRKDVIDKQAAVIILQSYLDRQRFLRENESEQPEDQDNE